jgi:hypothetical protein
MITHQPKWSDKPLYYRADYETYLKIKALKRWYWITVQNASNWRRWARKLYPRGPEPLFCEVFGHHKKTGHGLCSPYWKSHTSYRDILQSWLSTARYASAEPVEELNKGTVEQIDHLYQQVSAWFAKHGRKSARIDPVAKHRAIAAYKRGEYKTSTQMIAELKNELEQKPV